ncbi:CAP-Gly domain-containing linker protein 1-like [Macrobrachium nipponense]|uniref:CAP-Gly domain-containing linker protein 1-like n=1 Tax=Macrobrachium nipponense TaxID=159736 RepID=UPI0030C83456
MWFLFAIPVVLFTEVFILRGFGISMVRFFVDFSALDNPGCLEEAGNLENQVVHSEIDELDISDNEEDDASDNEEDSQSDCEDDDSSDSEEESPHLDTSRKFEEVIMKNENAFLRLEKERLEKDQLINELAWKVKALTQGRMKMEEHIRDLELLNKEKDTQIHSMSEEMQILKSKIIEKAKVTEVQMKEREEKDQKLIILENTVVVLEMEKETLHRDLQLREEGRIEMQVRITELNEDLQSLRKENRRKEKTIESLKKESEQKTSKISDLEDGLQVLVAEKQMAQENVKQLYKCKAELVEKKEELEKLKEENLQKDRELLRLENECTLKQMEVIRLQKASQTVVAENPTANGKLNEIRRRKVQLEFELAEAKEELETTEFEKMEAILELESLQEETLAKDTKIRGLETKVKMLTGEEKRQGMKAPISERKAEEKKTLDKARCLRKPQINCEALSRQIDSLDEKRRQIKEFAANLRKLEQEAKMFRELYRKNADT